MDLGLKGKKAIVCASSRGLGKACAMSLAREGVSVIINGRNQNSLHETATEIQEKTGSLVIPVIGDVSTTEGQKALLAACPTPDILINNTSCPPMGNFRDWNQEDWVNATLINMIGPIEMIKGTIDGMIERKFGRIINITSRATKMTLEGLGLSSAARAGLTAFVANLARKSIRYNVTINNLLPGSFNTASFQRFMEFSAREKSLTTEQEMCQRFAQIPAGRFGDPRELGDACTFLCSAQMGYVTGQNLLLDGGTYPGIF
ncbi:MAG: SDR family oxidoreductase [Oscillatoria sp. PMC 1051.18]|nr:SDR family oxidoreductase [Oscillatoria sp. PMC 1050.18]MEC5030788.1 SDR family oxidoreductase [Oscillatoria sp. PMC 1051.18]